MRGCPECARLRERLEEASETILAWEAYDRDPVDRDRLGSWKARLPLSRAEIVLLQALVDASGRPLGRDRLFNLLRAVDDSGRPHDIQPKNLDVRLTRLRAYLADVGAAGGLINHMRVGWVLSPTALDVVRQQVGEERRAAA